MTKYVVEAGREVDIKGLSRAEGIAVLKEEVQKLVSLIDAYNASAADNRVEVKETAWINTTVLIEATDLAAANLAMQTGLKVERPRKLTRD
jgi:hypothetical protein